MGDRIGYGFVWVQRRWGGSLLADGSPIVTSQQIVHLDDARHVGSSRVDDGQVRMGLFLRAADKLFSIGVGCDPDDAVTRHAYLVEGGFGKQKHPVHQIRMRLAGCDACLDSDLAKLIVVGECPTGVPNKSLDDGCTMNDVLTECSVGHRSHGEWTACVARQANVWRRQGLLSGKDVGRITHCAGTSRRDTPIKRVHSGAPRGKR